MSIRNLSVSWESLLSFLLSKDIRTTRVGLEYTTRPRPDLGLDAEAGRWPWGLSLRLGGLDLDRYSRAVGLSLHSLSPFFVGVMPPVMHALIVGFTFIATQPSR